jgi:hypothetical protein
MFIYDTCIFDFAFNSLSHTFGERYQYIANVSEYCANDVVVRNWKSEGA